MIPLLMLTGCSAPPEASDEGRYLLDRNMPALIQGKSFCLNYETEGIRSVFINGVNIGTACAGSFPGEFAIPKETYLRWFGYISDMNVQVIRVYVNQMPAFYEALEEFNSSVPKPLYLIHGVYCNEDMVEEYGSAYGGGGAFRELFLRDIRNAVDMIHGRAEVEKLPGNAGGVYTADVSRWVIGWILGIEWSADFVMGTNEAESERVSFEGQYVRTQDASPFEVFLAEAAETVIARDTECYGTQRPVALCNWCTTDPLDHPNEPSPEVEDAVAVDAEHILATGSFKAGFFASYHVYPYYPEFLSYDTKYLDGDDPDPYLAYLRELTEHHTMPVLISEYGIPTSRGIAHENAVSGMTQGHATEEQQAQWLIAMNRDIRLAGCAGGLIFSWQDEWFKRTWNSMEYENSDRRPFWYNAQSPEECFGLLSFSTGGNIILDGKDGDWDGIGAVAENDGISLYASSDEGYLYLLVRMPEEDPETTELFIPLDVAGEMGSHSGYGMTFPQGAEFLLHLKGRDDSRLLVDANYDVFYYSYAHVNAFFPPRDGQYTVDSGLFAPVWMAMNRPMYLPETGERTEFSMFETGLLRYGNTDPSDPMFDPIADICYGTDFIEIRLPWMLIGFMDPSGREVMGDLYGSDNVTAVKTDGVRMGVCRAGGAGTVSMELYTWDEWDLPQTAERLKMSYYILQEYFAQQ